MSTSKLALYKTFLFRNPRIQPLSTKLNNPFLFFKPPLHQNHRHHTSFSSFSTSTAAAQEETLSSTVHPWPEWISFVDRLTAKGYLSKSADDSSVYSDINLLKDASLSFARDRYDVFKLLSSEDIQAVVEDGCPNFLRKAVNSAKRLRAHLRLEEGDVCSACNQRDSCDRAYVILKESEADARTVDIVRILLFYAIDSLVLSGGEKPPGREVIESSARKLLSQLIELSESSPAPPPLPAYSKSTSQEDVSKVKPLSFKAAEMLSKNVEMKKGDWVCQKCNFMNFSRNRKCLNCEEDGPKSDDPRTFEMKKGDWICTECNFMNFSRNTTCLECKTEGPERVNRLNTNEVQMKKGDWTCPQCNFMNFSRNTTCLECKTEGPERVNRLNTNEVQMKKGDWTCPQCGFMNFASNVKCFKCPEPRPKKHPGDWNCPKCDFMNFASKDKCFRCQESNPNPNKYPGEWPNPNSKKYPGDWSCPKCDFYNYARNTTCLKCNAKPRKEQQTSEGEEHIWRRRN